jgi:hypothetical protein
MASTLVVGVAGMDDCAGDTWADEMPVMAAEVTDAMPMVARCERRRR